MSLDLHRSKMEERDISKPQEETWNSKSKGYVSESVSDSEAVEDSEAETMETRYVNSNKI